MERTGTITAVSGDMLEVTFCRPGDCEKCHACIGGEKKHVLLVKGEGHVGDAAVVSLPEQTVVKASALGFCGQIFRFFCQKALTNGFHAAIIISVA